MQDIVLVLLRDCAYLPVKILADSVIIVKCGGLAFPSSAYEDLSRYYSRMTTSLFHMSPSQLIRRDQ